MRRSYLLVIIPLLYAAGNLGCVFDRSGLAPPGDNSNNNHNNGNQNNGNQNNGNQNNGNQNQNQNNNNHDPLCGDGLVSSGEACDDGNTEGGDGCAADCTVEAGWECDGEPSLCHPVCGDSMVVSGEACDDGNTEGGDGCAADCTVETGWECDGTPSLCEPVCGDGLILGDETCDDSNSESGDGCSATCRVEPFHACDGEPSLCACVVFVKKGAMPPTDGSWWASALGDVTLALETATVLGLGCEVWVAEGSYSSWQGAATDTLNLVSGVALYGGFAGTETRRGQRAPDVRETILTGASADPVPQRVFHVVSARGVTGAVLDGFTIQGGNATGSDLHNAGGGLLVVDSALTVNWCQITRNHAGRGGAIYSNSDDLVLTASRLVENTATNGGGLYLDGASMEVRSTVIANNTASADGGGILARAGSHALIHRVLLTNNHAGGDGGGIHAANSSPRVESTVFLTNSTSGRGGGIRCHPSASPVITNATFYGNTAGSATWTGSAIGARDSSNPQVINSIIWNHSSALSTYDNSSITVTYSDVQGGESGTGNINQDPLFMNVAEGVLRLLAGSPCIDRANGPLAPPLDFHGNPRVDIPDVENLGVGPPWADMGAFEYQP